MSGTNTANGVTTTFSYGEQDKGSINDVLSALTAPGQSASGSDQQHDTDSGKHLHRLPANRQVTGDAVNGSTLDLSVASNSSDQTNTQADGSVQVVHTDGSTLKQTTETYGTQSSTANGATTTVQSDVDKYYRSSLTDSTTTTTSADGSSQTVKLIQNSSNLTRTHSVTDTAFNDGIASDSWNTTNDVRTTATADGHNETTTTAILPDVVSTSNSGWTDQTNSTTTTLTSSGQGSTVKQTSHQHATYSNGVTQSTDDETGSLNSSFTAGITSGWTESNYKYHEEDTIAGGVTTINNVVYNADFVSSASASSGYPNPANHRVWSRGYSATFRSNTSETGGDGDYAVTTTYSGQMWDGNGTVPDDVEQAMPPPMGYHGFSLNESHTLTETPDSPVGPDGPAGMAQPGLQFAQGALFQYNPAIWDPQPPAVQEGGQVNSQLLHACFAAGTPLLTPDGDKPIEEFKVGDLILSRSQLGPAAVR